MAGTQVIGVDPSTGTIRSWTFDADGGIGEATWSWDDGRWAIDSDATLADGSDSTALNFLTKTGPDNRSPGSRSSERSKATTCPTLGRSL